MFKLFNFQENAVSELKDFVYSDNDEVTLKSPTGSGKTIILSTLVNETFKLFPDKYAFIWFCPGQGDLEEQSFKKFTSSFDNVDAIMLEDLITNGLNANQIAFINWEKLNKSKNTAVKIGERKNFFERIDETEFNDTKIIIIIDESHRNFTDKTQNIIDKVKPYKTIFASATPINDDDKDVIAIKDEDVINEGLIKKYILLNNEVSKGGDTDDLTEYFLELAFKKQAKIKEELVKLKSNVNPLMLVQLPNAKEGEILIEQVEKFFEKNNITYANKHLAIWLDNKKENLENISDNSSKVDAIIFKQGIATGWDCPRAYILVKLRYNTDEVFTVQTIGRIRRMAELKHYNNDLLDSCYVYTADKEFIKGFNKYYPNENLLQKVVYLRKEYENQVPNITMEFKNDLRTLPDLSKVSDFAFKHYVNKYGIGSDKLQNVVILENNNYNFNKKISTDLNFGKIRDLSDDELKRLGSLTVYSNKDKKTLISMLNIVLETIRKQTFIEPFYLKKIFNRLFFDKKATKNNIIYFDKQIDYLYFIINNREVITNDLKESILENYGIGLDLAGYQTKQFFFPEIDLARVANNSLKDEVSENCVYEKYPKYAKRGSEVERSFENYLIQNDSVARYAKNGDKGEQYFSIIYSDNLQIEHRFYPDFIFYYNGKVWIVETKGPLKDENGESKDSDKSSGLKFVALKKYLDKYDLCGGFVRWSPIAKKLMFNNTNYTNDSLDGNWKPLDEIIK